MTTAHGRALLGSGTEAAITAMLQDAITELLGSGRLHGFRLRSSGRRYEDKNLRITLGFA